MLSLVVLAACIDPASFGAIPDDGVADTRAIQRAIDAAERAKGEVCLGRGVFDLDRPQPLASLVIGRGGITFAGVGPETVLRLNGDGQRSDWYGLLVRGRKVVVRDLAFDALATRNTEEQTHLIQLGPGARDVRLERLRLGPMRVRGSDMGAGAGGDCIRLLGEPDQMIEDVQILDSDFLGCDRSGIAVQRGVRRATIAHDSFAEIGDTPIDFEPTADGPIEDMLFDDLAITRTPDAQGTAAMTIGGHGATPARRITLRGSELVGGGLRIMNAETVTIVDNRIHHGTGAGETILLMRRLRGVRIADNDIDRPATAPAAPLIGITHNNGAVPCDIHIVGNRLTQGTDAQLIAISSADQVEIRDNRMTYAGTGAVDAILARAIVAPVDRLVVAGNTIVGPVAAAVRLAASPGPIGAVRIDDNRAAAAVVCEASGGAFRATIDGTGNDFGGATSVCPRLSPTITARRAARP